MNRPDELTATDRARPPRRLDAIVRSAARIPTPLVFAGSVGLAIVLLWLQGALGDIGPALRRADGPTMAAGLLLYLAGLALLCLRWHLLVRMIKGASDAPRAAEAFLTSVVVNYAAPVSLAIPSRAALTKRSLGLSAAETGSVALWEVVVDLLVLAVATVVWLLIGGSEIGLPTTSPSVTVVAGGVALIAFVVCIIVLFRRRPRLRERIVALARTFLSYPLRRPVDGALVISGTVFYWVGQAAVLWLLIHALDTRVEFGLVLGLVSLPVLVGMLSPVPGGAGVREALMVAVAGVYDADAAAVLLAALTYRVALFAAIPVLYGAIRVWLTLESRAAGVASRPNGGRGDERPPLVGD